MRKLIKRYFLAIAENPIENALIIGVVLFAVSLIIIIAKFGSANESIDPCRTALTICVFITVVLAFINVVVTSLKTTSFSQNKNKIILVYFPDGTKIYKKPIWGKYLYRIIKLPNEWLLPLADQVEQNHKIVVNLKIRIKKQIAVFKIELDFWFNDEFKPEELGAMLICSKVNENFRCFYFCECIEKIFNDYNLQDTNQTTLKTIIVERLHTPKSEDVLIKKIEEELSFPSTLFSNASIGATVLNAQLSLASFL